MKKMYIIIGLCLALSTSLNAQNFKLGIVDVETIASQLPEAKKAEAEITKLAQAYQDTITTMQKDLESSFANYQKQKGMMTLEQQQATEQELQTKQMELQQYYAAKLGQNGEVMMKNQEFMEPLRQRIIDAIAKVADAEGLSLVIDKNNPAVYYTKDKDDITFKVLDQMKRGTGAK